MDSPRYIIEPQERPTPTYEYVEGWAIIDTQDGRQVGWCLKKPRAEECAARHNATPLDPPRDVVGLDGVTRLIQYGTDGERVKPSTPAPQTFAAGLFE